ncbi:MAG: hypothetical protein ACI4VW_02200 [Acutalibacteraceae bacterium]
MRRKLKQISVIILILIFCMQVINPIIVLGSTDTIKISSAQDLMELSENCSLDTWSQKKTIELMADISLKGSNFLPIPTFGGTFEGNGYTITDLTVTESLSPAGLFGIVQENAVIRNLNVSGSISPSGDGNLAGGIAGENNGYILNCTFNGIVNGSNEVGGIAGRNNTDGTIKECAVQGKISGSNMTGGIAGQNIGLISSCSNKSHVNTSGVDPSVNLDNIDISMTINFSELSSVDIVDIATDTGGIAGYSSGMILGCSNEGNIGYQHLGYNVGGIVGRTCGHLANCTNSGEIFGRKDIGGIAGQMEPNISMDLSEDLITKLQGQLQDLKYPIEDIVTSVNSSSDAVMLQLKSINSNIDDAADTTYTLAGQVADYGDALTSEINRGSDILYETISRLSDISEKLPEISDDFAEGLDELEAGMVAFSKASEYGTTALENLQLAVEDLTSAMETFRNGSEKIESGLDELESAVTIKDKTAVETALFNIADGLGDMSGALSKMSDSVNNLIAVFENADWTDEVIQGLYDVSAELKNIAAALTDIHEAVTILEENIDVNWNLINESADELLLALESISTVSAKLDGALTSAETGIKNISDGLKTIITSYEDDDAVREAVIKISTGFSELAHAMNTANSAFQSVLTALKEIKNNGELSEQLDTVTSALNDIVASCKIAVSALQTVSDGIRDIAENGKINPEQIKDGAELVLQGMNSLLNSVKQLREANNAFGESADHICKSLEYLRAAVEINDQKAIEASLEQIHSALGTMSSSLDNTSAIIKNMASTMEKAHKWTDSLIEAIKGTAKAFSDFSDSLLTVQDGIDTIRENVNIDSDSAKQGISQIRQGIQTVVNSTVKLEESFDHMGDAMRDMESASEEITNAAQSIAEAFDTFENAANKMTDVLDDICSMMNYFAGVNPVQIPVPDEEIRETANNLYSYMTETKEMFSLLVSDLSSVSDSISKKILYASNQFSLAMDTVFEIIYRTQDGSDEGFFTDISEEDINSITAGKVFGCKNTGTVYADINVGGIVGTIAVEYGADPEDDVTSELSFAQQRAFLFKAIIQKCVNEGNITAKKDCAGSVCGKMDFGLIINCEGYGSAKSESGNYVGGIAGLSGGTVRSSFAKCVLRGSKYIGGIIGCGVIENFTGSGSVVSDCYSLVNIDESKQYVGAIAGDNIGEFSGNGFVSQELAAINRLSYSGKAEPITYDELLKIKNLPSKFRHFYLNFVADGKVVETITFDYGKTFTPTELPEIPVKEGYYASWDNEKLENLTFDTTVEAVYMQHVTALSSDSLRSDGRPVFLVEGKFEGTAGVTVAALDGKNPSTPKKTIEKWSISVPDDGLTSHTIRYLAPRGNPDKVKIYLKQNGKWDKTETETVGSYLRFSFEGNNADIAVVSNSMPWWVWLIIGIFVSAIIVSGIIELIKKVKKAPPTDEEIKKHAQRIEIIKKRINYFKEKIRMLIGGIKKYADGLIAKAKSIANKKPVRQHKKNLLIALAILMVIICCISVVFGLFVAPKFKSGLKAYSLLTNYLEKPEYSAQITVNAEIGSSKTDVSANLYGIKFDKYSVTAVEQNGMTIYYAEGMIILENGKAFKISDTLPDYSALLEKAAKLYKSVDITVTENEDETIYAVTVRNAGDIFETLLPSVAKYISDKQEINIELIEVRNKLYKIRFFADGTLNTSDKTELLLDAELTVTEESKNIKIPQTVKDSVTGGVYEAEGELTRDLLRLINAWHNLEIKDVIAADMNITADCGPLVLNESFELFKKNEKGLEISCINGNNILLYFTDNAICNKDGSAVERNNYLADTAKLLELAHQICINSTFDCSKSNGEYVYTLSLNNEEMQSVAYSIAPEIKNMDVDFSDGIICITVKNEAISKVLFECSGDVKVILSEMDASVSGEFVFNDKSDYTVPQNVYDALNAKEK